MQGVTNLTEKPVAGQLFRLTMPIIGTSFVQMAYSLTDIAWVGRLGSEAVAAVGAVGILTWMTNSISLLGKVGSEVSVGQSIGAGDMAAARRFASHNITIALIISLCWGILLFAGANPVVSLFRLTNPIGASAVEYLRIVASAFPFLFVSAAFTGIYNAAGRSKIPFLISATGLVMNMVLDPLFIFVFNLGTAGAAWATWLSQATVCLLFAYRLRKSRLLGGFSFVIKLDRSHVERIIRLGLPVAVLNTFFSLISLFMARTAAIHGQHIGVMTLTAGGQIEAIAWNTAQGFSTGLSAFVAQNYAAGRKERIRSAYHAALKMTSVFGLAVTLMFLLFPNEIFALIVPEPDAVRAGGLFLRIDGYSMMLMMIEITMQGLFYGTGRTLPPAVISIACNVLRLPLAIFLGSRMGISGVWWAISITSMMKGLIAFVWFRRSPNY